MSGSRASRSSAGSDADGRQRDPARRHREPVLVGEDAQRLHRLVVVVERLAHAHQHDVERRVAHRRARRRARGPGRRFRRRSGCGRVPSCRSGRSAQAIAQPTCVEMQKVIDGVSGMKTDSMRWPSASSSRNFSVPSTDRSRCDELGASRRRIRRRAASRSVARQVGHRREIGDAVPVDPPEDLARAEALMSARVERLFELGRSSSARSDRARVTVSLAFVTTCRTLDLIRRFPDAACPLQSARVL